MKTESTRKKKVKMLPYDAQAIFCRQMAFVVKAGIPLENAYEFLKTEADETDSTEIIECVFKKISGGAGFAEAMRQTGFFSNYLIAVVELGEKTGNLERALNELADYFEQLQSIRRKVSDAFTYPLILLIMMLAVILFLIMEVMPKFAEIISGAGGSLPPVASAILSVGNFFRTQYIPVLAVLVLVIAAIWLFLRSRRGHEVIDRISLSKSTLGDTTRKLSTSRFCQAMRMALSCGNSFPSSVELTAGIIHNTEVKARLLLLKKNIDGGMQIPEAMASVNLFPKSFVNLFATAYKTGNLEETLERMSAYYQESYDDAVYSLVSKIEPALVIILSVIAGILLFSVMIPIINIMQMIG